jgi:hypothetical protein
MTNAVPLYMHPSTTFPAEAGTQFTDPDGMERWVILESSLAGSRNRAAASEARVLPLLHLLPSLFHLFVSSLI